MVGLPRDPLPKLFRGNRPDYKLIGFDVEKKAVGFFMKGLLDKYFICPRCTSPDYFPWIEQLVAEKHIDYAFVQPEAEMWSGGIITRRTADSLVRYSWDTKSSRNRSGINPL